MLKSYTQQKLEAQRNKDIRDVVVGAFQSYCGQKNIPTLVAGDLGVTTATLYRWCEELGIDINDYRRPANEREA